MDSLGTSLGGEAEEADRKKIRKKKPEGKSKRILKTKRLRGFVFSQKNSVLVPLMKIF